MGRKAGEPKLGHYPALRTVDLIPEDFDRPGSVLAFALQGVAAEQAKNGDVIGALQTAHSIPEEAWENKSGALSEIASRQARLGDLPGAALTWEQAKKATETADSVDSMVTHLTGIASAQAQAKDRLGAEKTIQRSLSIARAENQTGLRNSMLSQIARSLALRGDFVSAMAIVEEVGDNYLRDSILFHAASSQRQSGNLEKALETAFKVKGNESRDFVLLGIAAERAGEKEFERALDIVRLIRTSHTKAEALALVAFYQAHHGNQLAAAEIFSQAIGIARGIKLDMLKDGTLGNIAKRQAQSGFVKEALEVTDKIKNEHNQEHSLEQIAWTQAKEGYWQQSLEWASAQHVPRLKAKALMGVAAGMLQWISRRRAK